MQIKDMFRKKIDREIQGVIIVGQGEETNVAQELEEYVVTRELQRHFADFFAAYKKGIQILPDCFFRQFHVLSNLYTSHCRIEGCVASAPAQPCFLTTMLRNTHYAFFGSSQI